ncbi:hypothetical protein RN347_00585 [Halomonas sp. PAMB 3264]|uniref:hypothetical protein n=1 Tax=unclassified Halomonas TaxID=2609666 RepID=UPI00289BE601|nr:MULTISPECIES: hypothetical protein [unclassified Halomonas]WNL39078.1 hypothetical protein RN346_00545 [Halomonas sp. PAMB 3232]WNL42427.1 hypothetical protein RN347_00585 [Halomonas sp. PAMB 3264]
MMIVDLVDGDDFRARLIALGIDLPANADPDESARLAASAHKAVPVDGLPALVDELTRRQDIVLPAVREAIERHLAHL